MIKTGMVSGCGQRSVYWSLRLWNNFLVLRRLRMWLWVWTAECSGYKLVESEFKVVGWVVHKDTEVAHDGRKCRGGRY